MIVTAEQTTPTRGGALSSNESSSVERRLATILIADVFDYSRLMSEDEERTVRTLRGHREVFDQLLKAHRGRSFNTAGDAALAEFPSAVEAVRCATEIQTALSSRNGQLPVAQRMWFRIGVNLGDVIVQEGDLLGDGVNVAARIQSIAEPGGVCISGSVYDQIQTKLTLPIRPLGEQSFKNIALPIRAFSISVDDRAPRPLALRWRTARKGPLVAVAGILGLIAVGAAGFWTYRDYDTRVAEDTRLAKESQRVAQLRLKAQQEQAAAAEARKEAALLAQLQSAKDALAKAEATKLKAEQERSTAETAQRQVKLQDEVKSAREVVQKAQQREKSAEDAVKAASAAAQSATAAVPKVAETPAPADVSASRQPAAAQAAMSANPAPPSPVVDAKSVDRFDGVYTGQMCAPHVDNTMRCWDVVLKAKQGALSAVWPSPWSTQLARASGTISPEGNVELSLAGFRASDGRPNPGNMAGRWSGNTITAAGSWTYGGPVNAVWKWTPGTPRPTDEQQAAGIDDGTNDDAQGSRTGGGRHRRR
jgi:class 3 adenylate cyclase